MALSFGSNVPFDGILIHLTLWVFETFLNSFLFNLIIKKSKSIECRSWVDNPFNNSYSKYWTFRCKTFPLLIVIQTQEYNVIHSIHPSIQWNLPTNNSNSNTKIYIHNFDSNFSTEHFLMRRGYFKWGLYTIGKRDAEF